MYRKLLCIVLILLAGMILCACSKREENQRNDKQLDNEINEENKEDREFIYENENASAFCVDDAGTLYALIENQNMIKSYDANGKFLKEYSIAKNCVPYLSVYKNSLYYLAFDSLYELNITTGESAVLYKVKAEAEYYTFSCIAAYQDSVFYIQKALYEEEQAEVRYDENDGYTYEGEKLYRYDLTKKEAEAVNIPNIKLITKKSDSELLVYAYDGEGGFCFTTYDILSGEIGDKAYTDMKIGYIYGMAYDDILDKVLCQDSKGLFTVEISEPENQSYFYEEDKQLYQGFNVQYFNEYTFCIINVDGVKKIVRLNNSAYIKDNPVLKSYVLGGNFDHVPSSSGYKIDSEELNYDELATVLLAGDTDYDFLVLSSYDQLARRMKDIGAYEPLNSVQGIDSLLGKCFDYIGEAATTDNGDIWMLPLQIECPIMIYNPELCKKYGIDIDKIDTCEKLINSVDTLPKDGSVFYDLLYYYFAGNLLDQYIQYYAIKDNRSNFNTDIFRKYAEIMKKYDAKVMSDSKYFNKNSYTFPKDNKINPAEYKDETYSKTALIIDRGLNNGTIKDYYEYDFFKAAAVPGLTEGQEQKSLADCVLIVLNPNSKKLKWAKDYLAKVCASIQEDTNCDMFKDLDFGDNKLRAELQEVYSEAEVFYQYPIDITDELEAYRLENKPLDDTIKEMERKMDMYLNE